MFLFRSWIYNHVGSVGLGFGEDDGEFDGGLVFPISGVGHYNPSNSGAAFSLFKR